MKGKLKEWLKTNGKNALGKTLDLVGGSTNIPFASKLLEGIGEALMDDPEITEVDKADIANMMQFELKELDLRLKDNADSRNMNIKVQESKEASWLAKNTAYILDMAIIFILGLLVFVLMFLELTQQQKELALVGLGSFSALSIQIIHFHRGSSAGSKDKTNLLNNK